MALPISLLVVLVWGVIYFARHPEPRRRARFLKTAAFVWMTVFGGFVTLFVAGETLSDPGGWEGAALVASWSVPLAALAFAGWVWPRQATVVLGALTAVTVGLAIWYALDPHGWDAFEDDHGPVRTIVSFVVLATLAFLAWRRPTAGGRLMLAVALVPSVLTLAVGGKGVALAAVSSPALLAALLFLWSARYERRAAPPPAPAQPSSSAPRAAA